MLELMIKMLSKVVSLDFLFNLLSINSLIMIDDSKSENEKKVAYATVIAVSALLNAKYQDSDDELPLREALVTISKEAKAYTESHPDNALKIAMDLMSKQHSSDDMEKIIKDLLNDDEDDEDDEEMDDIKYLMDHIHNCDECKGKGKCPIEQIMRDLKSGKITPAEAEEQAKVAMDKKAVSIKQN